jgi:hypothetical protein
MKPNAVFKAVAAAVAIVACFAASAGQFVAAAQVTRPRDAVSDQPIRAESQLSVNQQALVLSRAGVAREALDFPVGARRTTTHVHDGFQQIDYDEVDEFDSAGHVVSVTELDGSGKLLAAVRLDAAPRPARPVDRDASLKSAQRAAAAAGLSTAGIGRAETDPVVDGWTVHWARSEGGVPVRGDETRIHVWPDGRIQSISSTQHQLASAPARQLSQTQASTDANRYLDRWFSGTSSGYRVQDLDLEWVGPNGAFDASQPLEPQPVYRLAWVVNVKPSGAASDYLWLLTMYVDAGDGSLLGGDFVE